MEQSLSRGTCPNCSHDWTAHGDFIGRQERVCEEVLDGAYAGYRLRLFYTPENTLDSVWAYEGDLFVCQHHAKRAVARCKASITRRIRAN